MELAQRHRMPSLTGTLLGGYLTGVAALLCLGAAFPAVAGQAPDGAG
ncbi:hypothetical protein QNZ47_000772, partial [Enterobacter cloacae]|nr:hypothetical protein [Enterobacter cloacae]